VKISARLHPLPLTPAKGRKQIVFGVGNPNAGSDGTISEAPALTKTLKAVAAPGYQLP